MIKLFALSLLLAPLALHTAFAQVEHNYNVASQNTTCDGWQMTTGQKEAALAALDSITFRYSQQFRRTRRSGFQGAAYYSCDGETGILVVMEDGEKHIYSDVPRRWWQALTESPDPEGVYINGVKKAELKPVLFEDQ
jgi:hypothetical protein